MFLGELCKKHGEIAPGVLHLTVHQVRKRSETLAGTLHVPYRPDTGEI